MANINVCTTEVLSSVTTDTNVLAEDNGELVRVNLMNEISDLQAPLQEQIDVLKDGIEYGDETLIGYLADGSPVYNKTIIKSIDSWAETTSLTLYKVNHGIKSFDKILEFNAWGKHNSSLMAYPIPFVSVAGNINTYLYGIDSVSFNFYNKATWAGYTLTINVKYSVQKSSPKPQA